MAISDEIKQQTVKFKDMNRQQKIDYIWTYYKFWIIGVLVAIFVIISLTKTIIKNSKPVYAYGLFLNSMRASDSASCSLEQEFYNELGIDAKEYNTGFVYSTTLTNDYGNQASYAGQVKLMSLYSANQVDIITGEESVMTGSADVGGYAKLDEVLSDNMIEDLKNKGYEFFYYTEKIYDEDTVADENGNRPYTPGETYMAGLYIDNCKKLVGDAESCIYFKTGSNQAGSGQSGIGQSGIDQTGSDNIADGNVADSNEENDRLVLAIAWNSENIDHAVEFIKFVTE